MQKIKKMFLILFICLFGLGLANIHVVNAEEIIDEEKQEEVITDETLLPDSIETNLNEIFNWIVAGFAGLIGSGMFYAIINLFLKKIKKALTDKIAALEKQNKITTEQKDAFEKKVNEYHEKIDKVLQDNELLIAKIEKYIEIDQEKAKRATEILSEFKTKIENENKGE